MSAQGHTSDASILDRRTLEKDHRRLAALLAPGMAVLDVGCGTGAITAGIARRTGPTGHVRASRGGRGQAEAGGLRRPGSGDP